METIKNKLRRAKKGIRKNYCNNVFERLAYIKPTSFVINNYNRKKPLSAFNPGAILRNDKLEIYPRFIFEYYWYVSSIGRFQININQLQHLNKEKIDAEILLFPKEVWEIRGVEDPRVLFSGKYYILYTAVQLVNDRINPLQAIAILDENYKTIRKTYLKIRQKNSYITPHSWKDSAILRFLDKHNCILLTRPSFETIEICWTCLADLENGEVEISSFLPVLCKEDFELKVGWSTNTLKISSNEYLIGWHGLGLDMVYRNGLALLDENGTLKAITNYLLEPNGINEIYGDRPFVIFGCGLVQRNNEIFWIGGISDYAIGIFRTELDEVFENMVWVNKH